MAVTKIKKILVPFDDKGNQQHASYSRSGQVLVEYDECFRAHMTFKSIQRYSSNVVVFENGVGNTFYMSQGEFERCIPFMIKGVLDGMFYFHKQGNYFSLRFLEDAFI